MTLRQITIPWARGLDLHVGVDLSSGSPMNKVVTGEASTVDNAGGAVVDFQVQRIQSTDELQRAVGLDVEASLGAGMFGANVSDAFKFVRESRVQQSSLFLTVTATVQLGFLSIDEPALTEAATKVVGNSDLFASRFGNMFVRGLDRGGVFVGVLHVDTRTSEEAQSIANELKGSYKLFSASAQTKFSETLKSHNVQVRVRMWHIGGPVDLSIGDLDDPVQLLIAANSFLKGFKDDPGGVSRPYSVTLAPTSIALGPVPPNEAEVEHAQDVLAFCAKRRAVLLDQLNLVSFIIDNSSSYDFGPTSVSLDEIRTASANFQTDLDTISACATRAISDPAKAVMPADYAKEQGVAYPTGVLPTPLPTPNAQSMVPETHPFGTRTLQAGDTGPEVEALQDLLADWFKRWLKHHQPAPGPHPLGHLQHHDPAVPEVPQVRGIFNSALAGAVSFAQGQLGLQATGVADPTTIAAMRAYK